MYYWTQDIVTDPSDPLQNTWYVCVYSGWGGAPNGLGGLYKTIDRGAHWAKLTGSQFDRVTSITFNPQNQQQAYLTTETQGLWISNDMNATVPSWTLVSSYPFRQPHRVFFNPFAMNEVWVTSFGNGMKIGDLNATGTAEFRETPDLFTIFPNPARNDLHLLYTGKELSGNMTIVIYDITGRTVQSQAVRETSTLINIKGLKPGLYYYRISTGDILQQSGKVVVGR